MVDILSRYLSTLIVLAVGDACWLGYFGRVVVQPTLGPILRAHVDWRAVIAFYLLYAVGIVVFAVSSQRTNHSPAQAALYGAMFGFFAYMTYDLTNFATLSAWTVKLAVMDVAWGTFISSLAATAGCVASRIAAGR